MHEQSGHRGILPDELQTLFVKFHDNALGVEILNYPLEICKISGQLVHRMDMEPVTFPQIFETGLHLRPIERCSGYFVSKCFILVNIGKLPVCSLTDRANP
ncbi:MAG: hypothetical protein MRK01_03300 [Candidatus Scalindua sp.]|nr:hypothetical protein [Candidatus Scalindua sp.]